MEVVPKCRFCRSYKGRCRKKIKKEICREFCYSSTFNYKPKKTNCCALMSLKDCQIDFNPDGFTKKVSKEGINSYLRWRAGQNNPVFLEEMNSKVQWHASVSKIFIPSRKNRFTKTCYWLFGIFPGSVEEEWEILASYSPLWKDIKRKKACFHPDVCGCDEVFKLLVNIECLFLKRRKDLCKYHLGTKPSWISTEFVSK